MTPIVRLQIRQTPTSWCALLGGAALAVLASQSAHAQCSPTGALAPGSTVNCSGASTTRVGQGPGADAVVVNVADGASLTVTNTNAITLGDNAVINLGTAGGSAATLVRTTTDAGASGGQYGDGSNTIDIGSNGHITVNRNASVIAIGVQNQAEAINLYGAGNVITNFGLIQGGPSSAIFFQNVNTTAASPRNIVDNFGTIQLLPVGAVNPVTSGQAVGSVGAVGIDFTNETGAKVLGNLVFAGGNDNVTLNPGSTVSGNFDGGGGVNLLTLNASGSSTDTFDGQLINFQTLNKSGAGVWTLAGPIGQHTAGAAAPLAINVIGGTLILTGNNAGFDGSITINPGANAAVPGPNTSATLEARVQSLPPIVNDHGVMLLDQFSPDGVQPVDGTYTGAIGGTGVLTKIGVGTAVLDGANTYTGATTVSVGALAIGDALHTGASLSGGGLTTVASGAVLGGYGQVAGSVSNNGTLTAGNAMAIFAGGSAGTFTIGGNLSNQSTINLAGAILGNTLSVQGNYASSGVLKLNTLLNAGGPLSNQVTDRLLVFGSASGVTSIQVKGSGVGAATGVPSADAGISIVQVGGASSAGAFTLAGGYVANGTPFQYHLVAYGPGSPNGLASTTQSLVGNAAGHWDYRLQSLLVTPAGTLTPVVVVVPAVTATIVTATTGSTVTALNPATVATATAVPVTATTPVVVIAAVVPVNARPQLAPQVPAYITMPTALFNAGFLDINSLHRRLGEIRDEQTLDRGQEGEVFARGLGGQFNYVSNRSFNGYGFNSQQQYGAIQFGGDRTLVDNTDGTLRGGLAITIGRLSFRPSAVDGASNGLFNTESLSGIVTWQARAGWYVDTIVSSGFFDGSVTTPTRGQTTGMEGISSAVSMEVGYPVRTGWRGVSLEPQVQVVYQRLTFTRRTDIDAIVVDAGSPDQGVARVGGRITRAFAGAPGTLFTPYLKANLLQGVGGGSAVYIANLPFETGKFGTSAEVGGGLTGTIGHSLSLYTDVAWQQNVGNQGGSRGWTANGGLRWAF